MCFVDAQSILGNGTNNVLRSVTLACMKRPNEAGDIYLLSGADSTSHRLWRNLAADLTHERETAHFL